MPTRFVVIVPRDILDRLVPKQSEAYGLFARLTDAVTCDVPNGDKKIGLVWGGTAKSQKDWAEEFHMTERSFQRALAILKDEKLVVVHRGQHHSQLAITDCIKKTNRHSVIAHHHWLTGTPDPPKMAELKTPVTTNVAELKTNPVTTKMADHTANMAELTANMAELDEPKNEEVGVDAMPCGERDGREEVLEEAIEERSEPTPKSSPPIPDSTPTPTATPTLDEVCMRLYDIGAKINEHQSPFPGKYRAGVAELLTVYSADEICDAYRVFVRPPPHFDSFAMYHAAKNFVEGGARDIINSTREQKRRDKADHDRWVAKWRQREIDRERAKVEREILEEQEQAGKDALPSSELYQRYELAQKTKDVGPLSLGDERLALRQLRAAALKAPEIEARVSARLAVFDPGHPPSDFSLRQWFGGEDAAAAAVAAAKRSGGKVPTFDAVAAFRAQK